MKTFPQQGIAKRSALWRVKLRKLYIPRQGPLVPIQNKGRVLRRKRIILKCKTILACLLTLMMLLSLAACGGKNSGITSDGDSQPSGGGARKAAPADPASDDLRKH